MGAKPVKFPTSGLVIFFTYSETILEHLKMDRSTGLEVLLLRLRLDL